ncbi:MAG TPA: response regulator transcription factor [Thermomicrobiaceae bacterium]|nr:response regulator transcription factor [Thermomicrobiaceae bacterium]
MVGCLGAVLQTGNNLAVSLVATDLVAAREEERRRLHRDLHDDLGPALAAQRLKVGSARWLAPRDAAAADELLAELARDADDHPLFRDGLRALLKAVPGAELVGETATGEETVALATELRPDVILMDIKMPRLSGVEATRRIAQANPQVRILVVTMFEDDRTIFAAMQAGARGYLLKGASRAEMLRAIEAVASGEAIVSPGIAVRLAEYCASFHPTSPSPVSPELSERERAILHLIAQERGNAEIAARLALSAKTVRNHISNIFSKLQPANRAEAALRAREAGLGRERGFARHWPPCFTPTAGHTTCPARSSRVASRYRLLAIARTISASTPRHGRAWTKYSMPNISSRSARGSVSGCSGYWLR